MQDFVRYMEDTAGIAPILKPAPEAIQNLPAYFGSLYEGWSGELFDRHYTLLALKQEASPTPAEIAGHYRVAMRELGEPVAFVFAGIESFNRQRLVRYRIPFVVPRRQIYLPQFLVNLREGGGPRCRQGTGQIKHLSCAAQVLLLYYLQKPGASSRQSLREWAGLLNYSAMTITRVANDLIEAGLGDIEQEGRKSLLGFQSDRRSLWEKAHPFLRTPVTGRTHVVFADTRPLPWLEAGYPALSGHSMLADAGPLVVAMSAADYARTLGEGQIREIPFPDQGAGQVERWRYRPELLSEGPSVDRLSLYLSLRDDPDERVQAALKELLEGVQW